MKVLLRLRDALLTVPTWRDWQEAILLLALFGIIYLPIGFSLNFLKFQPESNWQTIIAVLFSSFWMPGVNEELVFRGLLIPRTGARNWSIAFSWLLFLLYHLHPFVPAFFRTPAFLLGAGLVGIVCTMSYLRSKSIWTAIVLHWSIVAIWLLVLGGLDLFRLQR
jgi:predicted Abi (CAAX) family protease